MLLKKVKPFLSIGRGNDLIAPIFQFEFYHTPYVGFIVDDENLLFFVQDSGPPSVFIAKQQNNLPEGCGFHSFVAGGLKKLPELLAMRKGFFFKSFFQHFGFFNGLLGQGF
ncbi:hypothetical protein ES703_36047 [subsurface metagenome]